MYAACLDTGDVAAKTVYMECPVREVETSYVPVTNPTDGLWLVMSEVPPGPFSTLAQCNVEPNSVFDIPIYFNPKTMGRHENQLLYTNLGEGALFVTLLGVGLAPNPNGSITINVAAKDVHTELLKVHHITEVLALLFLTLIPWPGPSVFKITCSRDNSKIVRKVIQNKWLPVLERFQVKLPLECPFHPARDIFAPQHDAKMQHRPSQWTCAFCGKSFYEERHLDTHFDQRHKNQINRAEDAVCLAEYCDIMRCQVLVAHGLLNGGSGPSTDMEVWQDAEAARKALAPAAPRSVARVPARRRRPRAAAVQPHPARDCPSTEVDPDVVVESEEKRTEDSEGDANHTSELCDADTVESSLPPDSRQRRLADLQAERAACDPARLQLLKVRCERVVHSCIATLLLHLTQHQFTELEDEMQRAVCWYLSCDRYWEDTAPTARAFPWPLLLALATGLALALCMCYYIIWIVFDSEEGSVAGSASVSMTTQSSPARAERLAAEDALLDDPDHDDHYIYVTYPPELKRRLLESCYNRTTRL